MAVRKAEIANSPRPNTVSTIPTHIPTINARNAYLICKIKCSCFSFVIVNSFFNKNKECALAHSSACGGCLQHHHCTPQCASCRRLLYNQEMKFPDYIKKLVTPVRFTEVISHLAVSIVIEGELHSLSESIAFRKVSCQCEFQLQIENSNKSKMNF